MSNVFPRPGAPLVEVERAYVSFPALRALDDVSLVVRAGEHTVIRGGNGAGKSTLLRVLRGEQWLDQLQGSLAGGGIETRGRVVWHTAEGPESSALVGRRLSSLVSAAQQEKIVYQGWKISGEELIFGGITDTAFVSDSALSDRRGLVRATAALLGAEALLHRPVPTLSQGQVRLLLIARALVRKPLLLLLDEVTEGLDEQARESLLAALDQAAKVSTLIMTSHRPETLPSWLRRTLTMENGRITASQDGVPDLGAALSAPLAAPVSAPLPPVASRAPEAVPLLGPMPGGSSLLAARKRSGGAAISLDKVTVYIDGVPILHDLKWTIRPGENWAVLGSNGAGKSTLLRLLAGDEFAALGGRISYSFPGREDMPRLADEERPCLEDLRRCVHLVSDQQQAIYGYDVTGAELVFSGFDNAVGVYRDASLAEREQAEDIMRLLDAGHLAQRRISTCSTGEVRRLLLARALVGKPALLLLDEPCSGLDAESRNAFLVLLDMLARRGVQMILVTHHPGDIISAINHTLRLKDGRIESRLEGRCPAKPLAGA